MIETGASTSMRRGQTPAAIAGVLAVCLGYGMVLSDISTAPATPIDRFHTDDSSASTSLHKVPYFQLVETPVLDTQPRTQRELVPWELALMASVAAENLIRDALDELRTEDNLDLFQENAVEFLDHHGLAGILALDSQLLRFTVHETEPLARRFLRALGSRRAPAIDEASMQILFVQLDSPSGGRRSAAASALGAFPSALTLAEFERRVTVEKNRIVHATLQAHIRTFKANGLSSSKAV
jgi:hypothetical protein